MSQASSPTQNIQISAQHECRYRHHRAALDYYLVLTGPPSAAVSSRGTTRPWCIEAVFLFDARQLRSEQIARGVMRGVASSVTRQQWAAAEIYLSATNPRLNISPQQAGQLRQFGL